jgi:hypothetical protein
MNTGKQRSAPPSSKVRLYTYLLAVQACILLNTHDGCKGESSLIECLQKVCKDHDCQYATINQRPQSAVGSFINYNLDVARILGHFSIDSIEIGDFLSFKTAGLHLLDSDIISILSLVVCRPIWISRGAADLWTAHLEGVWKNKELCVI